MKKLIQNLSVFILSGVSLIILLLIQNPNPSNFAQKSIVLMAQIGLVIFLAMMPVAICFGLWGEIKRKLYEKWRKEFEGGGNLRIEK